ncbi:MAG: hypothetical protein KC492_25110 [Myxococcales bacterium]|nr:hypothetical protein [Myxococcales bacterium]
MDRRKLSRRRTLVVVLSERRQSLTPGIWHTHAQVFWARRHLRGSEQPAGHYDRCGLSEAQVEVRWQGDDRCEEYSPEVRYSIESGEARKLAARINRAAERLRAIEGELTRAGLVAELGAVEVTCAGSAWTWAPVEPISA